MPIGVAIHKRRIDDLGVSIHLCDGAADFKHVTHLGLAVGAPIRRVGRDRHCRALDVHAIPGAESVLHVPTFAEILRDFATDGHGLTCVRRNIRFALQFDHGNNLSASRHSQASEEKGKRLFHHGQEGNTLGR
jgi:hypothetical protein